MMETKLKDSGIPWIGQIPEHWEVRRIKNLYSERTELSETGDEMLLSVSEYYGIAPTKEKTDSDFISRAESLIGYKICHRGDFISNIMLAWKGSFGSTDFNGIVSPAYCVYKPIAPISPKYYHYLFRTDLFKSVFGQYSKGIIESRLRLYSPYFLAIETIVPPLEEQERIAGWLDGKCGEIDELIEVEKQMIADLEDYRQAVITEAVTHGLNPNAPSKPTSIKGIKYIPNDWNEVNLLKVIYLRARLGWRGLKADEYVDEGYPFLSAFNIVNNALVWNDLNFINQFRYDESPEIKLALHDILIVKDGAGIGKCARVENLPLGGATVNSSLGVITVSDKLYYSYLFYFFLSQPFQDNVFLLKNGMGVPHLTQENLKSVRIPLPPFDVQQEIANYLDAKCAEIDELVKVKQEKIETLKQYRQSLIFEAVTGKTTITQSI